MAKISDLVNINYDAFNSMDAKQLRAVIRQMSSAANKRLSQLEEKGISTPATQSAERSGGKFSTAGKSLNELRAEYSRVRNFLKSETSTKKGYNKFQANTLKSLGLKESEITPKQFQKLWSSYDRLKEQHPEIEGAANKYKVLNAISERIQKNGRLSVKSIVNRIENQLSEIYESGDFDEYDEFSEFFDESEDLPL